MKFLIFVLLFSIINGEIAEKVIICGVCRDVEKQLPNSIKIIEKIGTLFDDYQVIVYENDSKDTTKSILQQWSENNPKVLVEMENIDKEKLKKIIINIKEGCFFKPEEIAYARNKVLEKALSEDYEGYDYLIWMDMDFKIPPHYQGIVETFNSSREWDAVFAYGVDPSNSFWDWYALRDKNTPLGSEFLGNTWWYMPKTCKLTQRDDWHPVYSAFGGCGIYKKSSIQGCRYSAVVTEDLGKLAKKIVESESDHPHIRLYFDQIKNLDRIVKLDKPITDLPRIENPNVGIVINDDHFPIFKMSSFVYQYPSVCEHVPFHATMILNGHGKLFINPRLIFNYGG